MPVILSLQPNAYFHLIRVVIGAISHVCDVVRALPHCYSLDLTLLFRRHRLSLPVSCRPKRC